MRPAVFSTGNSRSQWAALFCPLLFMSGLIICAAMLDLKHLDNRKILFRIAHHPPMFSGTVSKVEAEGLWIDASFVLQTMQIDASWSANGEGTEQSRSFCALFEPDVLDGCSGVSTQRRWLA